jgi:hypothetical protein
MKAIIGAAVVRSGAASFPRKALGRVVDICSRFVDEDRQNAGAELATTGAHAWVNPS